MDSRIVKNRIGAACGIIAVIGNVLGVVVLGPVPSAYRPDGLASWAAEVMASPGAAAASAVAFTIGLVALAGWALVLGRRLDTPASLAGGAVVAIGALLNAAGTLAPLVVAVPLAEACRTADACVPAAAALLGMSLALDALFNLLLGVGLILIGRALSPRVEARWLTALTTGAGLAALPVSLQVVSSTAAGLLVIAGPLWLAAVLATSTWLWRAHR